MPWRTKIRFGSAVSLIGACALTGLVVAACGSSQGEPSGSGFPNAPDASDSGFNNKNPGDLDFDSGKYADVVDLDAYYFKDPPPQWCGPAGGATPPPPPGGTADCPADKNRQGCACPVEGEVASCWPGPRANRNLGVCKDGKTTCQKTAEIGTAWGPCEGAVLPTPGGKGAAACNCFSAGLWDIKNVIPCFTESTVNNVKTTGVHSTYLVNADGGMDVKGCSNGDPVTKPTQNFSTNTLKVDCEGTFDLCMVIKSGDMANPKPTDCAIMDPVCTGPADYPKKNQVTPFPDLKSWEATTPAQKACGDTFKTNGGYAELSVVGTSYTCDKIDDGSGQRFVFQRFKYCPFKCSDPANKTAPECINCSNGASGQF